MRKAATLLALLFALAVVGQAAANASHLKKREAAAWQAHETASSTVRFFESHRGLLYPPTPLRTRRIAWRALRHAHAMRSRYAHRLMRIRARLAALARPPHYEQWLCIHGYEGSWTDPGAPFYGGLQMDYDFQKAYGRDLLRRKGTADHWTPLEQMWVAEEAYKTRGFYPWPNTARYCGLI